MLRVASVIALLACISACPSAERTSAASPPTIAAPASEPFAKPPVADTPAPLPARPVRRTLAVGDHHTCALVRVGDDPRGRVKCWGGNDEGQLGTLDRKPRGDKAKQMGDALPFVQLPDDIDVVAIDAENRRSCALDRAGKLWCWGEEASVAAVDLPGKVESFSLGAMHACALLEGGAVKCWGSKGAEIGLGDVQLGKGLQPIAVAAGASHTCVLLANAKIKCFGEGMYGVIGTSDTRSRGADPSEMGDALPFVDLGSFRAAEVVAGALHACARSTDHHVKCWGNNHNGQLGIGNREGPGGKPGQSRDAPPVGDARPEVRLERPGTVVALASDSVTTCALQDRGRTKDGALDRAIECWGGGAGGVIDTGPDVVPMAIAPGGLVGCAIVVERERTIGGVPTTGRVKCWGAWVPGIGIDRATGVPSKQRVESLSEYTPFVELGQDVRVVIP